MQPFWKTTYYPNFLQAAIVGILLAMIFSYSTGSKLIFEEGQKWQYDDLVVNTPVFVPLQAEVIDSLSKNDASYIPIYKYDESVLPKQLEIFNDEFKRQLGLGKKGDAVSDVAKYSTVYQQFGLGILKKIYEKGVTSNKIAAKSIKISRGDLMTEVTTDKIYNPRTAEDFITDTLPYSTLREPEFLYNLLEKKIVSNLVFDENANAEALQKIRQLLENHRDTIKNGEVIVKKGRKITPTIFHKLLAYENQNSDVKFDNSMPTRFLISMLFTVFCLFVLTMHTAIYYPEYLGKTSLWLMVLGFIVGLNIIHFFIVKNNALHPLLTPFLAFPLLLRNHLQKHWVAIAHLLMVVIASQITPSPFAFVVAMIMSGFFINYVIVFDNKPFGKVWTTLGGLSILAFIFYTLSYQQNIIFDPINILLFILLQGVLVLSSVFFEKKIIPLTNCK